MFKRPRTATDRKARYPNEVIEMSTEELFKAKLDGNALNFVDPSINGTTYSLLASEVLKTIGDVAIFTFGISGAGKDTLIDGLLEENKISGFGFGVNPDQVDIITKNLLKYVETNDVDQKLREKVENMKIIPVYLKVSGDKKTLEEFITNRLNIRGDNSPENIANRVKAANKLISQAEDFITNGEFNENLITIEIFNKEGLNPSIPEVLQEFKKEFKKINKSKRYI